MTRAVHFEILAEGPRILHTFYAMVFGWEIPESGAMQPVQIEARHGDDDGERP